MRPIDKGPCPLDDEGNPKTVNDYKDWRQDLIDAVGNWCCYCNMTLTDSPQVEHVVPKNPRPGEVEGAELDWANLLLACGPCNRAKSNHPIYFNTHYIPDFHNTDLVFKNVVLDHAEKVGRKVCLPFPLESATVDQEKANETIKLFALQQIKHKDNRAIDLRWHYRYEAWSAAILWRNEWDAFGQGIEAEFAALLTTAATGKGFFSVWMQIFHNIPFIRLALIKAFRGTSTDCYDANGIAIPRNGVEI